MARRIGAGQLPNVNKTDAAMTRSPANQAEPVDARVFAIPVLHFPFFGFRILLPRFLSCYLYYEIWLRGRAATYTELNGKSRIYAAGDIVGM